MTEALCNGTTREGRPCTQPVSQPGQKCGQCLPPKGHDAPAADPAKLRLLGDQASHLDVGDVEEGDGLDGPAEAEPSGPTILITHSSPEGTLIEGDPRPHHQLVKAAGFRWSSQLGKWYKPHSRDKLPDMASISSLSGVLEQAGFTVEVLVESTPRSMQEIEADRADRIKERQGRLSDKADRLASAANAQFAKADQHLGGGGYKGFTRSMDAGVTAQRESEDAARRATASEHNEAHRESAPATIRRIERLETEQRDIERKLTPCATSGRKLKTGNEGKSFTCPGCYTKQTVGDDLAVPRHGGAEGAYAERLTARQAELNGEVSYWRRHLASLEAQGVKLWGKGDFAKGDMAQTSHGWHKVVRANAKSLTVETGYSWTETLAYDRVIGKRRPESE